MLKDKIKRLGQGEYGFRVDDLSNQELVDLINHFDEWDTDLLLELAKRADREEEYHELESGCMGDDKTQSFFNQICSEMGTTGIDF